MATNNTLTYSNLGLNLDVAIGEKHVYFRVPRDTNAAGSYISESGKTKMVSKTNGGWSGIPGTDFRCNVQFGAKATAVLAGTPNKPKGKGKAGAA